MGIIPGVFYARPLDRRFAFFDPNFFLAFRPVFLSALR